LTALERYAEDHDEMSSFSSADLLRVGVDAPLAA
jgi:hypothetical protein